MSHNNRQAVTPTQHRRRMLRRLAWRLGFSLVQGAGYIAGSALATVLIWWLTGR